MCVYIFVQPWQSPPLANSSCIKSSGNPHSGRVLFTDQVNTEYGHASLHLLDKANITEYWIWASLHLLNNENITEYWIWALLHLLDTANITDYWISTSLHLLDKANITEYWIWVQLSLLDKVNIDKLLNLCYCIHTCKISGLLLTIEILTKFVSIHS